MRRFNFAYLLGFFLLPVLLFISNAAAETVPAGYRWFPCPEIKTRFLLPSDWHYKMEPHGETTSYFFTKEDISSRGEFRTGLTLNVVRNVSKKAGVAPSVYAKRFVDNVATKGEVVKRWSGGEGKMMAFGVQVKMEAKSNDPYRLHTFANGNDATGTIYIFSFESPEKSWASVVPHAVLFVDNLSLDEDI